MFGINSRLTIRSLSSTLLSRMRKKPEVIQSPIFKKVSCVTVRSGTGSELVSCPSYLKPVINNICKRNPTI